MLNQRLGRENIEYHANTEVKYVYNIPNEENVIDRGAPVVSVAHFTLARFRVILDA